MFKVETWTKLKQECKSTIVALVMHCTFVNEMMFSRNILSLLGLLLSTALCLALLLAIACLVIPLDRKSGGFIHWNCLLSGNFSPKILLSSISLSGFVNLNLCVFLNIDGVVDCTGSCATTCTGSTNLCLEHFEECLYYEIWTIPLFCSLSCIS